MPLARLLLANANLELLDAAIADQARLGQLLGAAVADDWAGFPEALPFLRDTYTKNPSARTWGTVFFLLDEPRTLIGMGGYKCEPSPAGVVEIGYAIAPAFRRGGLATEAARQLVARAFADPRVVAVDAQTLGSSNPSTRVLEKLGMQRIGDRADPEHGTIWHWRLQRPAGPSRRL